jgi:hypothetical protein
MMKGKYPIVAILKFENIGEFINTELTYRDFEFQEWAYLKSIEINIA